ncbi:uncharacterized protein JCM6883_003602 [Sporobolomyces salmoneus]|uniref:uncharacterized protein n=1 Tax=Sporobolomyces salmoneus TaxID=183962 RepID=UPI00317F3D3E
MIWRVRTALYSIVFIFSFLAFALSAAFIVWTNSGLSPLREGSVAVLAACLLNVLTLSYLHFRPRLRPSTELILLFVLWITLLLGAASFSDQLTDLDSCEDSNCSLGIAIQAFAWLSWIALTFLLGIVAVSAMISSVGVDDSEWSEPLQRSNVEIEPYEKEAHSIVDRAGGTRSSRNQTATTSSSNSMPPD